MEIFLYFYLYSFAGWLLETGYAFLKTGRMVSRQTLLNTPMCPIYGLGAVFMILFLSKDAGVLLNFSGGFFLSSSLEYLIAMIYEECFLVKCWDYSRHIGNLHGRVCIGFSLCWGVISVMFVEFLHPAMERLVTAWSGEFLSITVVFLSAWVFADLKKTAKALLDFSRGEPSGIEKRMGFVKKI